MTSVKTMSLSAFRSLSSNDFTAFAKKNYGQEQPHIGVISLLLVLAYIRTPLYNDVVLRFELLVVVIDHYGIAPKLHWQFPRQ